MAEKAGMRMGDVVVELDGRPILDASGLTTALASRKPGDEVELGIIRYGERMTLETRETVSRVPGSSQEVRAVVREWVCRECDYFEETDDN